jgi:hypothetical protein
LNGQDYLFFIGNPAYFIVMGQMVYLAIWDDNRQVDEADERESTSISLANAVVISPLQMLSAFLF